MKHTWQKTFHSDNIEETVKGYLDKKDFPFEIKSEQVKYEIKPFGS
jgi:hypothetical protein